MNRHAAAVTSAVKATLAPGDEHRAQVLQEAATMVLYVAVVEMAELVALPLGDSGHGEVTGPVGLELLAIVWGTAVGLALAHWFAFRLAAAGFRGDRPTRLDAEIGLAQLGGATLVAALSSIPVLLFSDANEQKIIVFVPAVIIGVIGYSLARTTGRSRFPSVVLGSIALALGVVVAIIKSALSAH